mmetsp:Transcript_16383/g.33392  ORF Transcript_16383/g.33392 Transcript_16383/m.33392 type:complete len:286 (-) Transcript_16383:512-1369(-)
MEELKLENTSGVEELKPVNTSGVEERDRRTVFVGNVPVTTSRKRLRAMFVSAGTVESVRIRGLVPEIPGLSKRVTAITKRMHPNQKAVTAYVVFKEEEAVSTAIGMDGAELDGRHLRVAQITADQCLPEKKSVFIGNLPFDVDEEVVREAFQNMESVEVTGVRIVRDRGTGMGKGFGFVSFRQRASVGVVMALNGSLKIGDRDVRVMRVSGSKDKSADFLRGPPHTTQIIKRSKGANTNRNPKNRRVAVPPKQEVKRGKRDLKPVSEHINGKNRTKTRKSIRTQK